MVIAIIGVLSALLMVNFVGIRQRARDATRKSDLRQIQSGLELYRSDVGSYPASITCGAQLSNPPGCAEGSVGCTIYLKKIPCDPLNVSPNVYQFCVYSSNTRYALRSCVENSNDPQKDTPSDAAITNCNFAPSATCNGPSSSSTSYTLQNP